MKKKMFLAFLLTVILTVSSLPTNAFAESMEYYYGDIPTTEEEIREHLYSNQISLNSEAASMLANTTLPTSVDLSKSKNFPPIGNQVNTGACGSFATTYYQFTYEKNKLLNTSADTSDNWASPRWTYSLTSTGDGTTKSAAYDILKQFGAVSWTAFPFPTKNVYGDSSRNEEIFNWCNSMGSMVKALDVKVDNWYAYPVNTNDNPITSVDDTALSVIKAQLYNGTMFVISTDSEKWTTVNSPDFGKILVRDADTNAGHAMAVVGYDDSIYYDVNGNGVIEDAERGAFKLANSWGTNSSADNHGFLWVLYDALNVTTEIPGDWEPATKREAVFGRGAGSFCNIFTSIILKEEKPLLIAKVTLNADNRTNIETTIRKTPAHNGGIQTYKPTFTGSPVPYSGSLIFDFSHVSKNFEADTAETTWSILLRDKNNDDSYITNASCSIIDNLGITIADLGSVDQLTQTASTFEKELTFLKGDVDYDGRVTAIDAMKAERCADDLELFSNLQTYLADMNNDGVVTDTDAKEILRKSVGL